MLYKRMQGRLGNQMFQYAAMRAYAEKYGDKELCLDFTSLGDASYKNDLEDFNVCNSSNEEVHFSIAQKIALTRLRLAKKMLLIRYKDYSTFSEKLRKYSEKNKDWYMRRGVYSLNRGYMKFAPTREKNKYFDGYFESPKFFNDIREVILREFTPKYPIPKKNEKIYEAMQNSESVCISIRRGDWVKNKQFNSIHFVCGPEYFERAMKKVKELVKNPRFFVFSDDIEWVKKNMNFPKNSVYEDGTDPVWEKMRMMYSCKHFIISNSTFSWWTQYLSRNPKKVVIAPDHWKNGYDVPDIYEDGWTLVKAGGAEDEREQ